MHAVARTPIPQGMVIVAFVFAVVNTLRYGKAMDEKLNRYRWLAAGLQALAENGADGLRIMTIAAQLDVTKGSFYWHFKNLDDYRTAVLQEWERHYTGEPIHYLEHEALAPTEKLRVWVLGATLSDLRLERAIRAWSSRDAAVNGVCRRVDAERMGFLVKLLAGVGWDDDEARTLAQWAYCAWVGLATLGDIAYTDRQLAFILSMLMPR
jgi:AcrR family transcriptional regulator